MGLPPGASHVPPVATGAYPLRAGNRVRPLVDGEPAFRRIGEAVASARARVWVTVAFVHRDLELPDGHGSFFALVERAAAHGLEVRVLFWREPELGRLLPGAEHFAGTAEERAWLAARGARFLARWDHLPSYCHHQKSWVIDAGEDAVGFVGGINLDPGSIVAPGHPPRADVVSTHDAYLELHGPAVTDVEHNFVQRWNEASERTRPDGCWPDARRANDLPFPRRLAAPAGDVPVQITRTVRPGRYASAVPAPGGVPYPVAEGERSVLAQYLAAVDAARGTIYLENQFVLSPALLERLEAACRRGVEVVFVVPAEPMAEVRAGRLGPRAAACLAQLAALGAYPGFTLAGLTHGTEPGRYADVYVHAKLMLIDDAWLTIGSANALDRSLHADTELNASCWHPATARALRVDLLREHLGLDTSAHDHVAALRLFAEAARTNRARRQAGAALRGLAVALDPASYARD